MASQLSRSMYKMQAVSSDLQDSVRSYLGGGDAGGGLGGGKLHTPVLSAHAKHIDCCQAHAFIQGACKCCPRGLSCRIMQHHNSAAAKAALHLEAACILRSNLSVLLAQDTQHACNWSSYLGGGEGGGNGGGLRRGGMLQATSLLVFISATTTEGDTSKGRRLKRQHLPGFYEVTWINCTWTSARVCPVDASLFGVWHA